MFEIGEKVVYGNTGVCILKDIIQKEIIKNKKQNYYVLKPLYQQNNTIYAPVDSDKIFIRKVISKSEAEELIEKIPQITEDIIIDNDPDIYRKAFSSHDCKELIVITAIIYQKKRMAMSLKKKLGYGDEKNMRLAENLLFGELACALDIDTQEVPAYIKSKIGK